MSVGKIKVVKVMRVGEKRTDSGRGVISGLSLTVNMKELVKNLRMHNGSVKNAKRMTRGSEEKRDRNIEFDTKEL